jgi:hypothetical protein
MKKDGDFYKESQEGFEAVMQRMLEVLGRPLGSYAMALDVNENTIKTWRKRGKIPVKYLDGFARENNVSLDYLLYGVRQAENGRQSCQSREEVKTFLTDEQEKAGYSVEVLSKEEQALLENFRNCSQDEKLRIEAASALFAELAKQRA